MAITLAEMAEAITDETLPEFLQALRTRPEPHSLEYESLLLELAAETLHRSPFSIFREYAELTGKRSPEVAERLWKVSFPCVLINLKPVVPGMGIVLQFPVDRLKRKAGAL